VLNAAIPVVHRFVQTLCTTNGVLEAVCIQQLGQLNALSRPSTSGMCRQC
jgi:hypothetical protein